MKTAEPAASAAAPAPLAELRDQLEALERAYIAWDLPAIARASAASRAAVERLRRAGAAGAEPGLLRQVMALTRRCQRLAEAGSRLSGSLARIGRLTYEPIPADEQAKEAPPTLVSPREDN